MSSNAERRRTAPTEISRQAQVAGLFLLDSGDSQEQVKGRPAPSLGLYAKGSRQRQIAARARTIFKSRRLCSAETGSTLGAY